MITGKHSRQSSTSSTTSTKSGKSAGMTANANTDSPEEEPNVDSMHTNEVYDLSPDLNDSSSDYHSSQEEGLQAQQQLSSLELENKLLKSEVASLNQEMSSVIDRVKMTNKEVEKHKRKTEMLNQQLSRSDQIIRELQSRESDLTESLGAKDSQLAVLRVRYEEADKELKGKTNLMKGLENERERILQDHSDSSGLHSQALDGLKEKYIDLEAKLRLEQEATKAIKEESMQRQSQLEMEKQNLAESLTSAQRKLTEEKTRYQEITNQSKSLKSQSESARQELVEYKEKAARILQSKDKLIASLKDGTAMSGAESGVSSMELDQMRQERDMLREEIQQSRMTIENLRTELQDLEIQLQTDAEASKDQISELRDQFESETRRREDAEQEVSRHKQELKYAHENFINQKSSLQARLNDREKDIEKLRTQLTTKSMSSTSQTELEGRLHALTESLIQKQTMLEALSTEKNSLVLQLERMEKQYRESEMAAVRASATAIHVTEEDEVRQRMPSFMRESPQDTRVTRNLKTAANSIDRFSVRLGIFLRRYPIARVFVILYMMLLHLWVMVVLLTYQPEIHSGDFHNSMPKPPQVDPK
ncbi:unnamed protein product [Owenia fusiformis]|nr:unnamed protein product [Owenia fusiformis]